MLRIKNTMFIKDKITKFRVLTLLILECETELNNLKKIN